MFARRSAAIRLTGARSEVMISITKLDLKTPTWCSRFSCGIADRDILMLQMSGAPDPAAPLALPPTIASLKCYYAGVTNLSGKKMIGRQFIADFVGFLFQYLQQAPVLCFIKISANGVRRERMPSLATGKSNLTQTKISEI